MTTTAEPYDGCHLIADLHQCERALDDIVEIERALRGGVDAAGATLLELRLHSFGPGQGITGVALLAESHISIHTWPEHGYAALDFFLCGRRHDVTLALAAVKDVLRPGRTIERTIARGYGSTF